MLSSRGTSCIVRFRYLNDWSDKNVALASGQIPDVVVVLSNIWDCVYGSTWSGPYSYKREIQQTIKDIKRAFPKAEKWVWSGCVRGGGTTIRNPCVRQIGIRGQTRTLHWRQHEHPPPRQPSFCSLLRWWTGQTDFSICSAPATRTKCS